MTPIQTLAREAGYAACGVCGAEPFAEFRKAVEGRMHAFPGAAPLYEPLLKHADPRASTPWARSIVVCVRHYGKYGIPAGLAGHIGRNYLVDSRNPECPDHGMAKRIAAGLKGLGFRVRKGGVPDRWAAARAGVARFGRNGFAYSDHGSWVNLETWRVDAALPADPPTLRPACPDGCRACIDACPTGALVAPFVMRMDRCVAHLTYAAPLPIAPELWEKMGGWVYGCDACQDACPLNAGKWVAREQAPWLERIAARLTPDALATMDEETYRDVVHPRFWYISRDGLARWHANARRAVASTAIAAS